MATLLEAQQALAELHLDERTEWIAGGTRNKKAVLAGLEETYNKLANTSVGARMLKKSKTEITVTDNVARLPIDFYELGTDQEQQSNGVFVKSGTYYSPLDKDRVRWNVLYDMQNGNVKYNDNSQTDTFTSNWTLGGPFTTHVGQSFQAVSTKIDGVTFKKGTDSDPFTSNVTVAIYEGTSSNPTGSAIDSYVITNSIWVGYAEQSEITVELTANLNVGQRYWLVFSADSAAFESTSLSGTNANADSTLIWASSNGGSVWTGQASNKAIYFVAFHYESEVVSEYSLSFVDPVSNGSYYVDYIPKHAIPSADTDIIRLPPQLVRSVQDYALVEYYRGQGDWGNVGNSIQYAEGKFNERASQLWDN